MHDESLTKQQSKWQLQRCLFHIRHVFFLVFKTTNHYCIIWNYVKKHGTKPHQSVPFCYFDFVVQILNILNLIDLCTCIWNSVIFVFDKPLQSSLNYFHAFDNKLLCNMTMGSKEGMNAIQPQLHLRTITKIDYFETIQRNKFDHTAHLARK